MTESHYLQAVEVLQSVPRTNGKTGKVRLL